MRNPEYKPGDVLWRAGGSVVRYKPFLAHNHVTKAGIEYCGAQIVADEGTDWRAKVMLTPSLIGERVFAKALAPRAILGDGVTLRVEGAARTVVEVLDAKPTYMGSDQAASVQRGEFHPGALPDDLY
jgi:hypothetical protein